MRRRKDLDILICSSSQSLTISFSSPFSLYELCLQCAPYICPSAFYSAPHGPRRVCACVKLSFAPPRLVFSLLAFFVLHCFFPRDFQSNPSHSKTAPYAFLSHASCKRYQNILFSFSIPKTFFKTLFVLFGLTSLFSSNILTTCASTANVL